MRIDKLLPPAQPGKPWTVALEGGDTLRVSEGVVVSFALYGGMELEEEALTALRQAAAEAALKERAGRLLTARMLSAGQLAEKLTAKGATQEQAARVVAWAQESETGREVSLNEVDIDNFIRAKGAIFSAIDTLLHAVDMTVDMIDKVYVAGGIGSGINMENAVNIGMFPDVEPAKFHYIGNSSLTGAYAMVVSDDAAAKTAEVAANMTYLELSTYPGYMDSFVAACFLPHTDARLFPHSRQE